MSIYDISLLTIHLLSVLITIFNDFTEKIREVKNNKKFLRS